MDDVPWDGHNNIEMKHRCCGAGALVEANTTLNFCCLNPKSKAPQPQKRERIGIFYESLDPKFFARKCIQNNYSIQKFVEVFTTGFRQ